VQRQPGCVEMRNFRSSFGPQEISGRHLDHRKFPVVIWTTGSNMHINEKKEGGLVLSELWCSIGEYRHIAHWTKDFTERRIRQMLQTGTFPAEYRRVMYGKSGKKYHYQIKLTKDEDIRKLVNMRSADLYVKEHADANKGPDFHMVKNQDKRTPSAYNLNIKVPVASYLDVIMQNTIIQHHYRIVLNHQGKAKAGLNDYCETAGHSESRKNRYNIRCNENMRMALHEYAQQYGLTIKEAYVHMLMEYLKTPEGRVVMCMAQATESSNNNR